MTRRDNRRDHDSDDWFEAEPVAQRSAPPAPQGEIQAQEDPPTLADDWLASASTPVQASRRGALDKVGLTVAALLVALFAGLAIAGVFTSTHRRPPTAVTTTPRRPTTTTRRAATTTTGRSVVTPPTTTLKPGDTGSQVTDLQQTLAALGYSTGTADGNYGPATQSAVARFQRASGLTADGVFGSQTLSALSRTTG